MEIKIPFYNVLNMFLTGFVFLGGIAVLFMRYVANVLECTLVTDISAGSEVVFVVCAFAIAYEIGLIINRIGSVVLEPLLKVARLIPFDDDYIKFNKQQKKYPIMSTLSREYALSRTCVVLFLLLSIAALFSETKLLAIPFTLIAIVYFFSSKKHAEKIVKLMAEPESETEGISDNIANQ